MTNILSVFPVSEIDFYMPKWAEMLPDDHWLKLDLIESVKALMKNVTLIRDARAENLTTDSQYVKKFKIDKIEMENGSVKVDVEFDDTYYYNILSDMIGVPIQDEYQLISTIKELASKKNEYEKDSSAYEDVRVRGYGVVMPTREEIAIEEPIIMKHGNKFGVKIKATSPSVHMIKANIETEIAPLVGSEKQSEELVNYLLKEFEGAPEKLWESNIFGKSLHELISEGLQNKLFRMPEDAQLKLQETLQKIINEGSGGLICIIL
jgi:stage IV sporulation protein A